MTAITQAHNTALAAARRYKVAEIELVNALQTAGEQRIYYHYKFNSLFQYAVNALELSEEVAYIFINVARKAAEVPALKNEIRDGNISVSKAKVIGPVLNIENQKHWLGLARTKSKRQLEREVALASPKNAVRERVTYASIPPEDHAKILDLREVFVEVRFGIPEQLMLKLRHVQDLISQSKQRHVTLGETIEGMVNYYLQRNDPLEKAKRQKMRGKLDAEVKKPVPGPANVDGASRIPLTAAIRHQVNLRHHRQCSFVDRNGRRCTQRRMLEIHHIVPVQAGGANDLSNLILLCRGHHRAHHIH